MARPDKVAVVDRVTEQLNEAAATLLTDYRGLSVTELAELRAELRKVDASYHVVKNTLTRLAAQQAGMEGLEDFLVGPTALVFCGEDPVGPAKALKAFSTDHDALSVKGGFLDGEVLDAEAARRLADLASREELLATFAGMLDNALAGFARLMQAPIADMARLAAALESDGGVEAKGFSPTAPVAPAAEETDADADAAPPAAGTEAADAEDAAPAADAEVTAEAGPDDAEGDSEDVETEHAAPSTEPDADTDADDADADAEEADDVAAEASDASSASSDSSDSDDSPESDDSDDSDDSADDAPGAPTDGAGDTIDDTDAVEETEADDDLRETAEDVDAEEDDESDA